MFTDVKVPKENRIGEDGFGFKFAMAVLNGGRIGIASQALGIASGAYELALKYAKERKAFGTEIINHQAVAFKLADMHVNITAARMLCFKAAVEKTLEKIFLKVVLWQSCLRLKQQWILQLKQYRFMVDTDT